MSYRLYFFWSIDYSVLKTNFPLVLTEMVFCEKTNKRKHSMINKKSKYTEVDEDDENNDDSDNECQY